MSNSDATSNGVQPHAIAADLIQRGHAVSTLAGLALTRQPVAAALLTTEADLLPLLTSLEFAAKYPTESEVFRAVPEHFNQHSDAPTEAHIRAAITAKANTGNAAAAKAHFDLAILAGYAPLTITDANAREVASLIGRHIALTEKPVEKPRRFTLSPLNQILLRSDPVYLVHKLLTVGSTSLLTARHASFKSFFALDIALCVATGRLWHGYEVKRGSVVYVAAEGAAGLKQRAAAWLAHHGQDTPDNFFVVDVPLRIHEPLHRAEFIKEIGDLKPALIVLDTLARCAIGLDENSAGDMGQFADAIGELARETGAHVLTVHHNNKGGEYRGSSAVPAAVDTHLSMERRGDNVTLKTEKQKDDEELPELLFEKIIVPIPNTGGEKHSLVFHRLNTRAGGRGAMSDIERKALDALVETFRDEQVAASKWAQAALEQKGLSGSSFHKARGGLLEKKAVTMTGEQNGKGANAPRYQVAPEWAPPRPIEDESETEEVESEEKYSILHEYSTDSVE